MNFLKSNKTYILVGARIVFAFGLLFTFHPVCVCVALFILAVTIEAV